MDMAKLLGHLVPENSKETLKDIHLRNLVFGDYMDPTADVRIYDEVQRHLKFYSFISEIF